MELRNVDHRGLVAQPFHFLNPLESRIYVRDRILHVKCAQRLALFLLLGGTLMCVIHVVFLI